MSSRPPIDGSTSRPRPIEVAIVGSDALVAALPARPVQLFHALHAMGYDFVIPVSWGEELVAEHALRALSARGRMPAIFCACMRMRERLLASGSELSEYIVAFLSPAVAAARYVRALHPTVRMRVTFIGGCDTGGDPAINSTIAPNDLLHRLAERGISAVRQPAVFDSVIPPDRRRFYSLPGGCPAPNAIASHAPEWRQVTIDDDAFVASLAEFLLDRERVVINLAPRLGCSCCSALKGPNAEDVGEPARARLAELEPPRALAPVLDHDIEVSVDAPALRRTRVTTRESVARDLLLRAPELGVPGRATATSSHMPRDPEIRELLLHEQLLRDLGARESPRESTRDERRAVQMPNEGHVGASASLAEPSAASTTDPTQRGGVGAPPQTPAVHSHEESALGGSASPGLSGSPSLPSSPGEREVTRSPLPADVAPPRRTGVALRLERGQESGTRRRIAVTPASVPVTPARTAGLSQVASLGTTAAAVRQALVPAPNELISPQEETPPAGIPALSESRTSGTAKPRPSVAPLVADRPAPVLVPHAEPRASTPEAPARTKGTRVHDTFAVARLAARTRSARVAATRQKRAHKSETAETHDDSAIDTPTSPAAESLDTSVARIESASDQPVASEFALPGNVLAAGMFPADLFPPLLVASSDEALLDDRIAMDVESRDESDFAVELDAASTSIVELNPGLLWLESTAAGAVKPSAFAEPAPDAAAVEGSAVDAAAADVPVVDVPVVDVPVVDVPVVDVPAVDVPAVDVRAVDVRAVDVRAVDVSAVDVPAVDVPAPDAPAVDAFPLAEPDAEILEQPAVAASGDVGAPSERPAAALDDSLGSALVHQHTLPNDADLPVAEPQPADTVQDDPASVDVVIPEMDSDAPLGGEPVSPSEAAPVAAQTRDIVVPVVPHPPLSYPIESPIIGGRIIRGKGRSTRPPLITSSERVRDESSEGNSAEPHPLVTLAISVVAIIAVLVALALVLQRNPLAP